MAFRNHILQNRSFRRFFEAEPVPMETLRALVDLGRLSASAANLQPLKYILSNSPERNAAIFPHLAWAGYLPDWPGPEPGERPAAYIVMVCDKEISKSPGCDHGIAAQSILLGAVEQDLGGCMIGAIDRDGLRKTLRLPEQYDIVLVLALGKPKETVVLDEMAEDGSVKYWREANGTHHVPKRPLNSIILNL